MLLRLARGILKRRLVLSTLRVYTRLLTPRPGRFIKLDWRLAVIATLCGCVSIRTTITENQDSDLLDEDLERIVKQADVLFDNSEFEKLLEFLSVYKEYNEAEVLWRLSRANYKVAVAKNTTKDRAKELSYKAVELVDKSLELDSNSFAAHKWAGITLSHIGNYEGLTAKIKQAYKIQSHFKNALKLRPRDPTSLHLLGQWSYTIAEISWFERRLVSTVLATPPTSSYQEALGCFKRAEDEQPGFYSLNWLFLAKTLIKLNRTSEAIHWLDKLTSYRSQNEEDDIAIEEGRELKKAL